jgi:hypothetical protein
VSQERGSWESVPAGDDDEEPLVLVLGAEMARAAAAETIHRAEEDRAPSPLAGVGYDGRRSEFSLDEFAASPRDHVVGQFVEQAIGQDFIGRSQIRAALRMDDFYTLLTFAR